ncbi:very long chain fatty acid elongase 1 [Ptiloglossa arizonensis]|uniref:very long chain fatty acid elongase 1 n=1 Tax=Ptiloglossa arizonensis TaxID=3350558 RepID=UPI003FA1054B
MGLVDVYDFYWNQKADSRTNNLPLIGSPVLIPFCLFSYLYVVLKWGPEYMKNRKPYKLKTFVVCYNMFQIVINAYIVQQFISAGWFSEFSVFCEMSDYPYTTKFTKIPYTLWFATMIKLIDFVETFIFVLRKKDNQVTFLHLYHHISTVLISWFVTKYVPVAMSSFTLLINCSVHVIMYSYYLFSAFGKNIQKLLNPFKPLLTLTQMVQFIIIMMQNAQSLRPSCHVTKIPGSISIINLIINFILFYNFYQKRYKSDQKKS